MWLLTSSLFPIMWLFSCWLVHWLPSCINNYHVVVFPSCGCSHHAECFTVSTLWGISWGHGWLVIMEWHNCTRVSANYSHFTENVGSPIHSCTSITEINHHLWYISQMYHMWSYVTFVKIIRPLPIAHCWLVYSLPIVCLNHGHCCVPKTAYSYVFVYTICESNLEKC